jgi:uncharacterized protein (TIGR03067 family)
VPNGSDSISVIGLLELAMVDMKLAHPSINQLTAFAQGSLSDAELVELSLHLGECAECREKVEATGDDTLISLLRAADTKPSRPEIKDPPQVATVEALTSKAATAGLPAELAEHGRYRVQELLGVGGMGSVYKAEHLLMERPVALKLISHSLTSNPLMVERFRREVKTAARLKHPNIVMAYDAEQAGDSHFLVMEYVEGKSLARLVSEQGRLPVRQACDYVRQAALGLQHAHESGMVHRDIKPQNLMLTPEGQVKILDFGLARFALESAPKGALLEAPTADVAAARGSEAGAASLTQVGTVMGTPDYIAPEQATDAHTADIRADIYSLGCTLYDLLAGHAPFPEGTVVAKVKAQMERSPKPLTGLRDDVPPELVRVIERMMAKDPAQRYQTPAEVAAALQPFAASSPIKPRRRWRALAAAGALAAGILLAGVIYVQTDKGEFVIETRDEKIAVMVNEKGVKIRDQANGREYLLKAGAHDVRTGDYEVIVSELPEGIEIEGGKIFTVKRGVRVVATAKLRARRDQQLAANTDRELIQGVWRGVAGFAMGQQIREEDARQVIVTFVDDTMETNEGRGRFVLDPRPTPKRIKVTADAAEFPEMQGVYSLDGNTLRIYMSTPEHGPITTFGGKVGVEITLRRDELQQTDQQRIQGTWKGVSASLQGQEMPEAILKAIGPSITFTDKKVTWKANPIPEAREILGGMLAKFSLDGVFSLDPAKSPKTIDLTVLGAGAKTPLGTPAPRALLGIYKLEGDFLELCIAIDPDHVEERPTKFASIAGKFIAHVKLQRHSTRSISRRAALLEELHRRNAGPKGKLINSFGVGFKPITRDLIEDDGSWRLDVSQERLVRLYDVQPPLEDCLVTYRAKMKTALAKGKAYLEMWVRMPQGGEFFTRGVLNPVSGMSDWTTVEVPFALQKDERPDLFKLCVHVDGAGAVWIKDIEMWQAPLPAEAKRPSAVVRPAAPGEFGVLQEITAVQTGQGVTADQKGWRIEAPQSRTVNLTRFSVRKGPEPADGYLLTYRCQMKASALQGKAYLEMKVGEDEYFSRGLTLSLTGTTDWASYETSFRVEKGQRHPDQFRFNVVIEGQGTVWIKDIELLRGPLPK